MKKQEIVLEKQQHLFKAALWERQSLLDSSLKKPYVGKALGFVKFYRTKTFRTSKAIGQM